MALVIYRWKGLYKAISLIKKKNRFCLKWLLRLLVKIFYPRGATLKCPMGRWDSGATLLQRSVHDIGFDLGYLLKGFWLNFIPE